MILVSADLGERGLILQPDQVEAKSNEITALPEMSEQSHKGHGRREQRFVSIYHPPVGCFPEWPALATVF